MDLQCIFLQQLLGYGATNTAEVLENIDDNCNLLNKTAAGLCSLGFSEKQLSRLDNAKKEAERIYNLCKKENINIISYFSKDYPNSLRHIYSPAVVLYTVGLVPDFNNGLFVSVVGKRDITEYGKKSAFSLSARLALCGATIVTGGAIGGDSYANFGALAAGSKTVIVTGGGVTAKYLSSNRHLRTEVVIKGGLLISEFAPDYVPDNRGSFNIRNRIISGISDATVVIEATEKSGTLITAHEAAEQGKTVFAVPGKENDENYEGCKKLIKDGALPLVNPKDVISGFIGKYKNLDLNRINIISAETLKSEYGYARYKQENKANIPKKAPAPKEKPQKKQLNLSGKEKTVYEAIYENISADELTEKTMLSTSEVLSALTRLEIMGAIKSLPGSRYSIK